MWFANQHILPDQRVTNSRMDKIYGLTGSCSATLQCSAHQYFLCSSSPWICRDTLMLGPCLLALSDEDENTQKQESLSYVSGKRACMWSDRKLFRLQPSPTSFGVLWCQQRGSVQENTRFLEETESILGLLSFTAHSEGHFPLPDCPINQHPAGRGSFLIRVTTSDCLGCNTSRMSSSQNLIIVLTWQTLSQQVWCWMKNIVCIIGRFYYTVQFHLCINTVLCFFDSNNICKSLMYKHLQGPYLVGECVMSSG